MTNQVVKFRVLIGEFWTNYSIWMKFDNILRKFWKNESLFGAFLLPHCLQKKKLGHEQNVELVDLTLMQVDLVSYVSHILFHQFSKHTRTQLYVSIYYLLSISTVKYFLSPHFHTRSFYVIPIFNITYRPNFASIYLSIRPTFIRFFTFHFYLFLFPRDGFERDT